MFCKNIDVSQAVSYSGGVTVDGDVKPLMTIGAVVEQCFTTGLAPVMCLYMRGKPLNVSPSAVGEFQAKWKEAALHASVVVCIGVNPHAPDKHIWEPLTQTEAAIWFIGDEKEFRNWAGQRVTGTSEFLSPYFHTGYGDLERRLVQLGTEPGTD
ncbi:unnamed protein product [marine sediment metagenome]|uniref:Uncharacterized protein n=1 Tax=marine sediment metagenome TaxID=412755 RepID=X0XRE5_9ZZZZ